MAIQVNGYKRRPAEKIFETIEFPIEGDLFEEKIQNAQKYGQRFNTDVYCLLLNENGWANNDQDKNVILTKYSFIKKVLGDNHFFSIKKMPKNEKMLIFTILYK